MKTKKINYQKELDKIEATDLLKNEFGIDPKARDHYKDFVTFKNGKYRMYGKYLFPDDVDFKQGEMYLLEVTNHYIPAKGFRKTGRKEVLITQANKSTFWNYSFTDPDEFRKFFDIYSIIKLPKEKKDGDNTKDAISPMGNIDRNSLYKVKKAFEQEESKSGKRKREEREELKEAQPRLEKIFKSKQTKQS